MSIATCPNCHLQVSLPNTDDHTVWVRCPLCGGQYSLRAALDHVPPSLEILGPTAADPSMATAGGMIGFGETHAPNMPADEIPLESSHGHEFQAHSESGIPSDTLAHPEHGAALAPLGDEPFFHAEQGSNGEHTIPLEPGAQSDPSATQPPAIDHVAGEPHDISAHLDDFDLDATEHDGLNADGAFIGHAAASEHGSNEQLADHKSGEHPEHTGEIDLLENDPSEAMFGEALEEPGAEAEHAIGPNGEHLIQPSDAAEGDPEFQFADAEAGASAEEADEQHAMGGIATMVKTAPPPKKRRQAPLMVKLVGVLVGLIFGVIGCYIVFGLFLLIGNHEASVWGQHFHLKSIYPSFVAKHIADEPPPPSHHAKSPEKLTAGSTPLANPPAGDTSSTAGTPTAGTNPPVADQPGNNPPVAGQPGNNPPVAGQPGNNPPVAGQPGNPPATPGTPGSSDLARTGPAKTSSQLETTEDPTKTPPADLEKSDPFKSDLSKPDAPSIAPPKFETPALPFGDTKTPDKASDKTPDKSATPAAPDKTAPSFEDPSASPSKPSVTTEKPVAPDKLPATPDKPETPAISPDATPPVTTPPVTAPPVTAPPSGKTPDVTPDNTTEKPAVPATVKPDEHPGPAVEPKNPADAKSPAAEQIASADAALTLSEQTTESLKSVAAPGADRASMIKASVANYKAMSHLVTELGSLGGPSADPASAAHIEELRKKAAALAESMGSPAERDTTAMLAGKWIASPSRKEGGAVIVGTLVSVEATDKGFAAHIKMASDSKEMVFATAKKPSAADGSPVVVLGVLDADNGGTAVEILPAPSDTSAANPPTTK